MNRHLVASMLVVLALVPGSALAGAKEDLAEATRLLDNVEEEKAIPLLTASIARGDATNTQLAEMWALVAVAKFNLRDEPGSKEAFRKALDADPSVSISKLLPPKGWSVFEQARVERERELASRPKPATDPAGTPTVAKASSGGMPTRRIVAIAVGAAGVVGLATGIGLSANAASLHDQATKETAAMKADDLFRQGSTQNTAGTAMLVVGAVAAAAGVVLFVLPDSLFGGTTVSAGPTGIAVAGQF